MPSSAPDSDSVGVPYHSIQASIEAVTDRRQDDAAMAVVRLTLCVLRSAAQILPSPARSGRTHRIESIGLMGNSGEIEQLVIARAISGLRIE